MGKVRLATRMSGKGVTVFLTRAGSVARGKELAKHPKAIQAQNCIKSNAGNKTAIRQCMAKL